MTPEERKANRLYLASECMRETKQYLEAYAELLDKDPIAFETHCSAIFQLAIVCYCKSFISSNSRNKADPKIELEAVELFADRPDLKELHDKLFEKRHRLIAHTEWDFHATKLVEVYFDPGSGCSSVFRQAQKHNPCAGIDAEKFYELTELLEDEFGNGHYQLDCSTSVKKPI